MEPFSMIFEGFVESCAFSVRSHLDSAGITNPHFPGVRARLFVPFGLPLGALGFCIDFLRGVNSGRSQNHQKAQEGGKAP